MTKRTKLCSLMIDLTKENLYGIIFVFIYNNNYTANPVFGKSLCSDWFFLGQDFAVRTVSMETVRTAKS